MSNSDGGNSEGEPRRRGLLGRLRDRWERILRVHELVRRARFSVLAGLASAAAFMVVSQGREILWALSAPGAENAKLHFLLSAGTQLDRQYGYLDWRHLTWLVAAALLSSVNTWAWARLLCGVRVGRHERGETPIEQRCERDLPPLFAALPLWAVGGGFVLNAYSARHDLASNAAGILFGILGPVVVLFVVPLFLTGSRHSEAPGSNQRAAPAERSWVLMLTFGSYVILALGAGVLTGDWAPTLLGAGFYALAWVIYGIQRPIVLVGCAAALALAGLALSSGPGYPYGLMAALLIAAIGFGLWRFDKQQGLRTARRTDAQLGMRHAFSSDKGFARWLILLGSVHGLVLLVLLIWPIGVAAWIGPGAVLCLGLSLITCFGSLLVLWTLQLRLPILSLLLLWAAICSLGPDNHLVRTTPVDQSPVTSAGANPTRYRNVHDALAHWLERPENAPPAGGAAGTSAPKDAPRSPLFIVATEGGGIRAAYWTGLVLSRLQELSMEARLAQPGARGDFTDHCFAISGVSGGSVGAMIFDAVMAELGADPPFGSDTHVHDILSQDHLSAPLSDLFGRDLLRRFIPLPIGYHDRGWALETSFEDAYAAEMGQTRPNRVAAPFLELWSKSSRAPRWLPALFLNSTRVEDGRRVIFSNVVINSEEPSVAEETGKDPASSHGEFIDAADGHAVIGAFPAEGEASGPDLPTSTAAHNSARFTYVSPAGRLPDGRRLIDGGYYENSGAATALDLLHAVEQAREKDFEPILIVIRDFDKRSVRTGAAARRDPLQPPAHAWTWDGYLLSEILAPLEGLADTRDARGSYSIAALAEKMAGVKAVRVLEFDLTEGPVALPLGWMLSSRAARAMSDQMPQNLAQMRAMLSQPNSTGDNAAAAKLVLDGLFPNQP